MTVELGAAGGAMGDHVTGTSVIPAAVRKLECPPTGSLSGTD